MRNIDLKSPSPFFGRRRDCGILCPILWPIFHPRATNMNLTIPGFRYFLVLHLVALGALAAPPNVLLIVSEDNGPELGCYGDPHARTPNLDRLAAEGLRLTRAYVAQAGCSQSRASFLTGLYPHQHGQIGLATWGFRMYREDTQNIPRSLKAAGYRTGIIGKLHINPESAFPFDFAEIPAANFARKDIHAYARHAETFFSAGDKPFFLSVNYPDAHDPFIRQVEGIPAHPLKADQVEAMPYLGIDPPSLREMVADYHNCMARLDSLIGDLLAALERSGRADNTLVIYIGDHGADFLRGKRTCYEGGLRIPMILHWPGRIQPQVRDDLVCTVDLMPTILAATGAAPVPNLPGLALQSLFAPGTPDWRAYLFTEYHTHAAAPNYHPMRTVRDQRYKLIENLLPDTLNPDYVVTIRKLEAEAALRGFPAASGSIEAAIAGAGTEVRDAYAVMEKPPRYELYDLEDDPYEFRNLAGTPEHAAILASLAQALTDWRKATRDPLLEPKNLARLTEEVTAVTSKAAGRQLAWGYPDYFFGKEPGSSSPPPKGRGKKGKK
jgi:N-sulfoglucosamine sulfohydrolase